MSNKSFTDYCIGDVVQFNETHPWKGSLGVVDLLKPDKEEIGVAVPLPIGAWYIYCEPEHIEYIGKNAVPYE